MNREYLHPVDNAKVTVHGCVANVGQVASASRDASLFLRVHLFEQRVSNRFALTIDKH